MEKEKPAGFTKGVIIGMLVITGVAISLFVLGLLLYLGGAFEDLRTGCMPMATTSPRRANFLLLDINNVCEQGESRSLSPQS